MAGADATISLEMEKLTGWGILSVIDKSEVVSGSAATTESVKAERPLTKTPMYAAMNAGRYQRQELIKRINAAERTNLICYVGGLETEIDRNDVIGFVEMLHNIPENSPIDLLLNTGGGDVDACEKLVSLIHAKARDKEFRVIVTDLAKSAGTLMALGANKIIMSDASELGMIDPQFLMRDARGNELFYSVTGYLEAYEEHCDALRRNPQDQVALLMLDGFDARTVKKFQGIRDRVRTFAEDMLKRRGAPSSTISAGADEFRSMENARPAYRLCERQADWPAH
ncbi:ClpP class serine protease [Bradyrhizobium sp. JR4.1]|uniref:SDH family Clp fold serine proteinase n=1 Tax=Bradyrhizobium sp. JR4.1 TaxID=3156372 RepID=UPI003391F071